MYHPYAAAAAFPWSAAAATPPMWPAFHTGSTAPLATAGSPVDPTTLTGLSSLRDQRQMGKKLLQWPLNFKLIAQ